MEAFFSGTDDANENNTQFYAVWGRVTQDKPQFAFRYVVGDQKIECDPSVLIDWPTVTKETVTQVTETISVGGDMSLIDIELDGTVHRKVLEPEVKVSGPEIIKGPFVDVAYPDDWTAQHSKKTYSKSSYKGRGANSYSNAYGNYKQTELLGYDDSDQWDDYYGGGIHPSLEPNEDFFEVTTLDMTPVGSDISGPLRVIVKDMVMNAHKFADEFISNF